MKKHIQSLTYIVLVGLLMGGCTLNDGELSKTKTGREMFYFWSQRVEMLLSCNLEWAFNFNAWLTAPESEKQEVLDRYFSTDKSDCTFYEIAPNAWCFQYNGGQKRLQFELSGGNSLNDPDAVLKVRLTSQENSNSPFANCDIIIQNVSPGVWRIQTNGGENVVIGRLKVGTSAPASLLSGQIVSFDADGMFTFFSNTDDRDTPVYMQYSTSSPMTYTFSDFSASWWHGAVAPCTLHEGKVTLTAMKNNGEGNTAVITVTGKNTFDVEIGGVTQQWPM